MEFLAHVLPIIVYILLIVFLIIGIVIGVKLIKTMNKVDRIVDNIEGKVNSLNGLFNVIDVATSKINGAFEKTVDFFTKMVEKVISFKNRRKDDDEYE